jgi:Mycothiol maleylpyruvate isomerase N-terminal domain
MPDNADNTQAKREQIAALRTNIATFSACAAAIPDDAFLRVVTEWSPRDVTAHLIGWNVYTLEGCRDLRQGKAPPFLADEANDFKNVNAASVRRYASPDKGELLGQLQATAEELLSYLDQLEPSAWTQNFGVPGESGRPNLIINDVAALAADYLGHAQEITAWTRQGPE